MLNKQFLVHVGETFAFGFLSSFIFAVYGIAQTHSLSDARSLLYAALLGSTIAGAKALRPYAQAFVVAGVKGLQASGATPAQAAELQKEIADLEQRIGELAAQKQAELEKQAATGQGAG